MRVKQQVEMESESGGLVVVAAAKFFSHRKVHDLLLSWGELVRVYGDTTPEGWGWSGRSMDPKNMGGAETTGGMTLPERSIARLGVQRANIETIAKLVRAMTLVPRACMCYFYVHEMEETSIAVQIGASQRVVEQSLTAGRNGVRTGLIKLRERVAFHRLPPSAV